MIYAQSQITHTVNLVRDTFKRLKSAKLGKDYKPSPRVASPKIWEAIATNVLNLQADPAEFVEAAFTYCKFKDGPQPNQLTGKAGAGWWRMHQGRGLISDNSDQAVAKIYVPPGEEILYDMTASAVQFLKLDVGDTDLTNPKVIECLREITTPIPAVMKAFLGYPDPEILRRYGKTAQEVLWESPSFGEAAKKKGMPVDEIKSLNL